MVSTKKIFCRSERIQENIMYLFSKGYDNFRLTYDHILLLWEIRAWKKVAKK